MDDLKLDRPQVEKGVGALYKFTKKKETDADLLGDPPQILLQLGFQKIPNHAEKTIDIRLPFPLTHDSTEVCLFVKDLDKNDREYEATVHHYKELLARKNVTNITQVIPLKAINLEYKSHEAKRNLSNMYDVFLADAAIVRLLPGRLGKNFYGKKKIPIQVNMNVPDLKKEVDKALSLTRYISSGRGSTVLVRVGHMGMGESQVVSNIQAVAMKLAARIDGGAANIKCLHIKTALSPALPIYISTGSAKDVVLPDVKKEVIEDEPEEITTLQGAKVRVTSTGEVEIFYQEADGSVRIESTADKKRLLKMQIRDKKRNRGKKLKEEEDEPECKRVKEDSDSAEVPEVSPVKKTKKKNHKKGLKNKAVKVESDTKEKASAKPIESELMKRGKEKLKQKKVVVSKKLTKSKEMTGVKTPKAKKLGKST